MLFAVTITGYFQDEQNMELQCALGTGIALLCVTIHPSAFVGIYGSKHQHG
jgi:hypothetical protein